MTIRSLSVSLIPSPFMQRLLNDQTLAAAIGWPCSVDAGTIDANSRKMLDGAIDVAEMSLATFVKAREEGFPASGLPIFAGRGFPHSEVVVKADAGFRDFSDLRGKRVGLSQFWTTASVWRRLILSRQYGVRQGEVNWVTVNHERMGSLRLPPEARQNTSGQTLRELLLAGEIDAIMTIRSRIPGNEGGSNDASLGGLPESAAAEREYYERTHIFPIHHVIVMKQELAEEEPGLVASLCSAFRQAKEAGLSKALEDPNERPIVDLSPAETRALFGPDPWPYGVGPNRPALETFLDDARVQGLIGRTMGLEELFPSTLPEEFR